MNGVGVERGDEEGEVMEEILAEKAEEDLEGRKEKIQ